MDTVIDDLALAFWLASLALAAGPCPAGWRWLRGMERLLSEHF